MSKKFHKLFLLLIISILFLLYYIQISEISRPGAILSKDLNEDKEFGFYHEGCECMKHKNLAKNRTIEVESDCSNEASFLGPNQKIISYSFFSNNPYLDRTFFKGIESNLKDLREFYPSWRMRIYTNVSYNQDYCELICRNDDLIWCQIENLGYLDKGNLGKVNLRIWRFIPLGDRTVDIFVSRDLDGALSLRERVAVEEWENSDRALHLMRDSHWHHGKIFAGMWGAKNPEFGWERAQNSREMILRKGKDQRKGWDQKVLRDYLYEPYTNLFLAHDSYYCEEYGEDWRPFPTQRNSLEFVGADIRKYIPIITWVHTWWSFKKCPEKCRPPFGADWKYC